MKRNIERFPSKQMYPYLSLVERKVAEFYHNIYRRRWLVWSKWLIFITFSGQFMDSWCPYKAIINIVATLCKYFRHDFLPEFSDGLAFSVREIREIPPDLAFSVRVCGSELSGYRNRRFGKLWGDFFLNSSWFLNMGVVGCTGFASLRKHLREAEFHPKISIWYLNIYEFSATFGKLIW